MGIRGELFSTKFTCDGRTYFFNVKQNRTGDVFLSIVESKPSEGESFDRRSIVVFGEHMDGFLKSFQSALKFMDKTGNKVAPDESLYTRDNDEESRDRRPYAERSYSDEKRGFPRGESRRRDADFRDSDRSDRRSGGEYSRYQSDRRRTAKPAVRFSSSEKRPGARQQERADGKPIKKIVVRKAKKRED